MDVSLVHLRVGSVKNLNPAEDRFQSFGEPDPHLSWRVVNLATHGGLGVVKESMSPSDIGYESERKSPDQKSKKQSHGVSRGLLKILGKMSSR